MCDKSSRQAQSFGAAPRIATSVGPQSSSPFPSILQRALDMARRGASGNVVQREHFGKPEAGVESHVKVRVDRLQVGEREFLQIASAFHG
jgi:hypothetical protein